MPTDTGTELTGVLMCVTVLAGVGRVVHGGQQVGNFGSLRWIDVLGHVDDTVHGYFGIDLHETVKYQTEFILRYMNQLKLHALHLELVTHLFI